jgi:hypothetical protein
MLAVEHWPVARLARKPSLEEPTGRSKATARRFAVTLGFPDSLAVAMAASSMQCCARDREQPIAGLREQTRPSASLWVRIAQE